MIRLTCSGCGCSLRTEDELAGKKIRCPRCREVLRLPAAPTASPEAATVAPENTQPQTVGGVVQPAVPGYEILCELGRGGMGVVYKARQARPRRLVALKMVLAGEHAGTEALARFKREAEAVARLSHPSIVQIYEVGEHQGRPFLTLEFAAGGNLAQRLRQQGLKFQEAAELVDQLARAIAFAHKRGIVHRDLKPANVLLQPAGDAADEAGPASLSSFIPKIADFGLAKQLDGTSSMTPAGARTQSGAILGTPAYMAPEQAEGKSKNVGKPADVYALGAILYECLTGKPPFEAPSMLDTLIQVATQDPVPPRQVRPDCPRDLETICLKCLRKDPRDRYGSAGELASDLRRYLDGGPIKARPAGKLERLGRSLKRRKELAYLAGGALLAFGLVVLVLFLVLPSGGTSSSTASTSGTAGPGGTSSRTAQEEEESPESQLERATRRMVSSNHLKELGIAMHNHAGVHDNTLPPAAFTHPRTGQPLLSWRVALLPFIEHDSLYRRFKLDEPWDGPNNSKLLPLMPRQFEVPGVKTREPHSTFYQVFTGPQTPFEAQTQRRLQPYGFAGQNIRTFPDGSSNTMLIVEAAEAVPWTKPADLVYKPGGPLPRLGGPFKEGFTVAMADGSVTFVPRTVSEKTLRAAITRNGGEVLGDDWPGQGTATGRVTGKISWKGAPLPGGTIGFHVAGQGGKGVSAAIGNDGSFRVEKLTPGRYAITVTAPAGAGVQLPAKYADARTSEIQFTVRAGEQKFNIELRD